MMTVTMNRLLTLATVFVFCFALTPLAFVNAQSLAGGALKANLDLPFDAGLLNDDGEDEDAPEIITFYSQQYEGDGIFYAIDRSGSMQNSGELDIAKREVGKNIREFSNRVQFGIVFFDRGIMTSIVSLRASPVVVRRRGSAGGDGVCAPRGCRESPGRLGL